MFPSFKSVIVVIQHLINITFFLLFHRSLNFNKIFFLSPSIIILLFISGLAILFSSDIFISLNFFLKFSFAILFIAIGYNFNSSIIISAILDKGYIILIIFLLNIALSNLLNYGESLYVDSILIGFASINSLYLPMVISLIYLWFRDFQKEKVLRIITITLTIGVVIVFIILLKRTILLWYGIFVVYYLLFHNKRERLFVYFIFITIIWVNVSPILDNAVAASLRARESRFNQDYNVLEEGRFTELNIVLKEMKMEPIQLLFGTGEVFNDNYFLGKYFESGERELHNSYVRIFWNSGLFGLILYFSFFVFHFRIALIEIFNYKKGSFQNIFSVFMLFLVFSRIINEFSSGNTYISYNCLTYLLIGSLIKSNSNFKVNSLIKKQFKSTIPT